MSSNNYFIPPVQQQQQQQQPHSSSFVPQPQQTFVAQQQQPQPQQYQPSFIPQQPQPQQTAYQQPQQHSVTSDFLKAPTTQLGLQLGSQFLNVGQDYVHKNSSFIPSQMAKLKIYFNVTNMYVLKKLFIIVFPFRHSNWQRKIDSQLGAGNIVVSHPLPPRLDTNAPDLYIPTMAIVTYVLLVGVVLGLRKEFHPDRLGMTASGAIIFMICEVALVKLGSYILSISNDIQIIDMLAIIGYNFVSLIISLLVGILINNTVRMFAFIYLSFAMGFFMLRSLKYSFLPEVSIAGAGGGNGSIPVQQWDQYNQSNQYNQLNQSNQYDQYNQSNQFNQSNQPLLNQQQQQQNNQYQQAPRRTRIYFLFSIVLIQIVCSYLLLV